MNDKRAGNGNNAVYWIETFVIVAGLWFIMSGIFEAKFILYGLGSTAIITFICVRTLKIKGMKSGKEYFLLNCNWPRMIGYFFWLMWQIVLAAWDVSKVTLFHRDQIQPGVVWFKADYDNPAARALLANSITLTPGTITIDMLDDGVYSVHGLTHGAMDGVLDGSMQEKIAKVYGETINFEALRSYE